MSNARPIRIAFPVLGDSMGGAYFSMLELDTRKNLALFDGL